ncbi:MAG: hypothetical protein AAB551_03010 [Patescibacteria group bacterium]
MLIVTDYIFRHELKPLAKYLSLRDISQGASKVLKDLATAVKPPRKLENFRFFKVRIGAKTQGRMIVFATVGNSKIVPVLIRLKKDKIFGMNMSMNNPDVCRQIDANLERVLDDIEKGKCQRFEV